MTCSASDLCEGPQCMLRNEPLEQYLRDHPDNIN
jgi:hypothetical protein